MTVLLSAEGSTQTRCQVQIEAAQSELASCTSQQDTMIHGREGHACSQEATGNWPCQSIPLQAQVLKTAFLCQRAKGADLVRLLSSICKCPKF